MVGLELYYYILYTIYYFNCAGTLSGHLYSKKKHKKKQDVIISKFALLVPVWRTWLLTSVHLQRYIPWHSSQYKFTSHKITLYENEHSTYIFSLCLIINNTSVSRVLHIVEVISYEKNGNLNDITLLQPPTSYSYSFQLFQPSSLRLTFPKPMMT